MMQNPDHEHLDAARADYKKAREDLDALAESSRQLSYSPPIKNRSRSIKLHTYP